MVFSVSAPSSFEKYRQKNPQSEFSAAGFCMLLFSGLHLSDRDQKENAGSPDHFGQATDMGADTHHGKGNPQNQEIHPGFFFACINQQTHLADRQQRDAGNLQPDVKIVHPARALQTPGNKKPRSQQPEPRPRRQAPHQQDQDCTAPEQVQPEAAALQTGDILMDRIQKKRRCPEHKKRQNLTHILKIDFFLANFSKFPEKQRI
ncbi:hypothetical protein [uncultured Faecalibaculum sp.]|uniref:hypothetical protein n=1 Tax=uncultured Faecalibaculum sp. TaxID=1729681 RepID=UPI00262C6F96|nr:hypothetical protein [uncultured Faecalibaculum sp.]